MDDERIPLGTGGTEPPVDPSSGGGVVGTPGVVGSFGSSDTSNIPIESQQDISLSLGGLNLINPWYFNQTAQAQSLRCKPNGFKNTRGETPGHGAVLMSKANVDLLMAKIADDPNNLTTFTISDGSTTVTYERLQVYNIVSISGGYTPSDEEVYLVEFEDVRRALNRTPIGLQANLVHFRSSMPDTTTTDLYHYPSLTPGLTGRITENQVWTFDDIIEYCFYIAESYYSYISTQDIPTPLFPDNQGFCAQNVYATGPMWKILCQLGMRSMYFFTMNPNGTFNFIDPEQITTTIREFLSDYDKYLVYTDNNDTYEDYLYPNQFYPLWETSSFASMHMMRRSFSVGDSRSNTLTSSNKALINTHQPMPGDTYTPPLTSPAFGVSPARGWSSLCQTWARDYATRFKEMLRKNPPFVRSYMKVIDVDMETGVDMVHHDCQGCGPNNEGGTYTHVINRRIEFDCPVTWQDTELYRLRLRPGFAIFKALSSSVGVGVGGTVDVELVVNIGTPYAIRDDGITDQVSIVSLVGIREGDYLLTTYDMYTDSYIVINRSTYDDHAPVIAVTNLYTGIVNEVTVVDHYGPGKQLGVGSIIEVENPLGLEADSQAQGFAFWDQEDGYVLIQMEC